MLLPHVSRMQDATEWAMANARMLADNGRPDQALEWVRVALRVAGQISHSTPVLSVVVRSQSTRRSVAMNSQRILSGIQPSPTALRETVRAVSQIDVYGPFGRALVSKYAGVRAFGPAGKDLARGGLYAGEGPGPIPLFAWFYDNPLLAPLVRRDQAAFLWLMPQVIAIAGRPLRDPDLPAWFVNKGALARVVPWGAFVTRVSIRGIARQAAQRDYSAMRLRELQVALELKLYRGQHGSYPASLEELGKDIGQPLPRDPFSGKQFAYQRKADGFVLTATGLDALPLDARQTLKDRRMIWEDAR